MTEQDKVYKVLMMTQDYGSKLVEAEGYRIIGELDNAEDLRKEAKGLLTEIAKVMKEV